MFQIVAWHATFVTDWHDVENAVHYWQWRSHVLLREREG